MKYNIYDLETGEFVDVIEFESNDEAETWENDTGHVMGCIVVREDE